LRPNKLCAICKLRPAEFLTITRDNTKCIRALEEIQAKGKFKEFLEDFEKSGSGE